MAKTRNELPPVGEVIFQRPMEEVMPACMMPYSEHVILERALPRVEDGLKPVQRRILYTMIELGNTPDKPHRKCARIVGDCLGKYHPHGDSSVYDALARMAQPFVMRGTLVDGHGNFGSIDGDSPAAMRYTEARMTPLAMELLRDIDKDTVGFHLNFDDTQKEPDVLPGRYPNLLVNGASGIAVGLATNIPPHNLGEAIDGVIAQIENPEITTAELMQYIPAPDFPTGGILLVDDELKAAYETGRGKLQVRASVEIERGSAGRSLLVVNEVPYQVNKAQMLEKILRLSEEKKALFAGIYDIRDESDRTGMRAVIELKRDVDPEKTLNALYKYSDLQVTYGVNIVAIAGGKPVQLGLKALIGHYIRHQKEVVTRRTQFDLEKAKARAHILEGLIIAVDNLDEVIRLIRASKTPKEARTRLMERFALSELQAQAILDMRLQRLTNLEVLSLRNEYAALKKEIARLEAILASEKKLLKVIVDELRDVQTRFADPRRTRLMDKPDQAPVIEEVVVEADPAVVLVSKAGGFKRMQPRLVDKASELPPLMAQLPLMTNDKLLAFTNTGFCYAIPVEQIPDGKPKDRFLSLSGICPGVEKGERLVAVLPIKPAYKDGNLLLVTAGGLIKRCPFSAYEARKQRIAALNVKAGDNLLTVLPESGAHSLLLVTARGMAIHFATEEVPVVGRTAAGVKGIGLSPDDRVIAAVQHDSEGEMLLCSERGYMKRCLLVDFDPQARGGKGARCFPFQKNGANGSYLVGAYLVTKPRTFLFTQKNGETTPVLSESVRIELRGGKGQPFLVSVLDDIVTDIAEEAT